MEKKTIQDKGNNEAGRRIPTGTQPDSREFQQSRKEKMQVPRQVGVLYPDMPNLMGVPHHLPMIAPPQAIYNPLMTNPFVPPPNMMGYLQFPPPPFPYGASGPYLPPPWAYGQLWPGPTATNNTRDGTNQAITNSLPGFSHPYAFPTPGMQWHHQHSIHGPSVAPLPSPPISVPIGGRTNSAAGSVLGSIQRSAPKGHGDHGSKLAKKKEAPTVKWPTQVQTTTDRSIVRLHPKSTPPSVPASKPSKPKTLKLDRHLDKALKHTKVSRPSQVQKPEIQEQLVLSDMETAILDESMNCFHIFDRRINVNAFADNCSVYSLLREWVHDDPQRYTQLQDSNLKSSSVMSSQRREEGGEFDQASMGDSLGRTRGSFDQQEGDKNEVVDTCQHKKPNQMQVLEEMQRYVAGANSSCRPTPRQFFTESSIMDKGRKRQRAKTYKLQRDVVKKALKSKGIDL